MLADLGLSDLYYPDALGLFGNACLMKAGHQVEIYEQAPELAEIGAGIQISANAMHVLRHLGLEAAITSVGVSPGAYVFRLHDTFRSPRTATRPMARRSRRRSRPAAAILPSSRSRPIWSRAIPTPSAISSSTIA